jgi:hypothetical protein
MLPPGAVETDRTRYSIGEPPRGWSPEGFSDNDLFFHAPDKRHSIAVNSTCDGYGDAPLDVLTRHLVEGFSDVEQVEKRDLPMDGRSGLFSRFRARLDGVPIEMALVVLKKDGCVYDFTYLSPPGRYDDDRATFEALLARFHAEPKS